MSKRDWIKYAALGVAICLSSPTIGDAKGVDKSHQRSGHEIAAELKRMNSVLEEFASSQSADKGCQDRKDKRESDLCAQWKAADAAFESAEWTRKSYKLSIYGTIIGALALGAAGAAAWYARETMLKTREIGRDQSRAYVHVESAMLEFGDESSTFPHITLTAVNTGQTPVKWIKAKKTIFSEDWHAPGAIVPRPKFSEIKFPVGERQHISALGGGVRAEFTADAASYKNIFVEAIQNEGPGKVINVAGIISYETIYNEVFESEFWFRLLPPHLRMTDEAEREIPQPMHARLYNLRVYAQQKKEQKPDHLTALLKKLRGN